MACSGVLPPRSASSAKSICMIAFFSAMPISMIMPTNAFAPYDLLIRRAKPWQNRRRPTMSIAVGTRFGVYEIVAALGAGGMGEVYRARDTKLGRDVAI